MPVAMKRKTGQLLDKAQDAIEAADFFLKGGKHSFAAGRAYYAMFYVACSRGVSCFVSTIASSWQCVIIGAQVGRGGIAAGCLLQSPTQRVADGVTADGQRRGAMGLEEQELRERVQRVAHGEASRRQFIRTMLGLGLSGPLLADLLAT